MKAAMKTLLPLVFTASVLAQTSGTFVFRVSGVVSPSNPTVTVEVWAAWDQPSPDQYYWSAGNLDLVASEGVWSNPGFIIPFPPASSPGQVVGSSVSGIWVNQFVCGVGGCITPNTSNPYPLIRVEWTTSNFTPRMVDLQSENTNWFVLGETAIHTLTQLYPQEFTPGAGFISVVPAPAAWLVFALPLATGRRRQRC